MNILGLERKRSRRLSAYSIAEAVIAVFLLGVLTVALFGAFSSGLALVQLSRENVRATQLMMQKMETLRLLTWSQELNTQIATTNFTDWYDPSGVTTRRAGAQYRGMLSVSPAPTNVPAAYRSDMRTVTVTVYWTNYPGSGSRTIVRSRQMQTLAARYGMQNYVY